MLIEHFLLPPLSLLHKIRCGTTDTVKCAQVLRNESKISNDVHLMVDEMYLQKCEEHFAGDLVGCNSESELYKGLVYFIIVNLKDSIPYVIKASLETKTNAAWLNEEFIDFLGILSQTGFYVRAINNLLQHFNHDPDEMFIWYELRKIYLFYDAFHLVKNI